MYDPDSMLLGKMQATAACQLYQPHCQPQLTHALNILFVDVKKEINVNLGE
jgi:hypothetical protein